MYREKLLHEIALEIYKNCRITCATDDDDDDDDDDDNDDDDDDNDDDDDDLIIFSPKGFFRDND